MDSEIKSKVLTFLSKCNLMVISSLGSESGLPESAVVAFAETEDIKLIFGTSNTSRKYENIKKNSNVSIVIGWDSNLGTIQCEGFARELSPEEKDSYVKVLSVKNPQSEKFRTREDQKYFIIEPKWLRLLDMTVVPDETFEMRF